MLKQQCDHVWEKHSQAERELDTGTIEATFICHGCNTVMTASEVVQLESLNNQAKSLDNQTRLAEHELGFQKILSVIAFVVSVIAILLAWLK